MITKRAVCYVSSMEYLLPSLVSAAGIRKYVGRDKADILIYLDGGSRESIDVLNEKLSAHGIVLAPLSQDIRDILSSNKTEGYITATAFGRLFIADQTPSIYDTIVYIDGDTWIKSDPTPLIELEVPDGKFAAAEDTFSFRRGLLTKSGKLASNYIAGLGIAPNGNYLNSGLFVVKRDTFTKIGREAFQFYRENRQACMHLDQSALNAVMGDRRLPISLKWNFQSPARFMGVESRIDPRILHFTQYIKPWMAQVKPWEDVFAVYTRAAAQLDDLGLKLPLAPATDLNNHKIGLIKNVALHNENFARIFGFARKIMAYERKTVI